MADGPARPAPAAPGGPDADRRAPLAALQQLAHGVVAALGAPAETAAVVAESLVESDARGMASHGVRRLVPYAEFVRIGRIDPAATPVVERATGGLVALDGRRGFGQLGARAAVTEVTERARTAGIAAAVVRRCNHIGRLGEYVETLADAGLVGIALCNADSSVAPFGGRQRLLGTNPLALSVPAGGGRPAVVVDWATSATAEGKLAVARARGEQAPPGAVLDASGAPTTDPADFYAGGALLPFGAHKGYGLSVFVELLGGLLGGSGISSLPGFDESNGTVVIALDVAALVPLEGFRSQVEAFRDLLHGSAPAQGSSGVLVPGEPEASARERALVEGVALPAVTAAALVELAEGLGVVAPSELTGPA